MYAAPIPVSLRPLAVLLISNPPPLIPSLGSSQIKEFGEPQGGDTAASKDQAAAGGAAAGAAAPAAGTAAAAAAPGAAAGGAAAAAAIKLDLPNVEVIPHALQKLEKPADEMYTVCERVWGCAGPGCEWVDVAYGGNWGYWG